MNDLNESAGTTADTTHRSKAISRGLTVVGILLTFVVIWLIWSSNQITAEQLRRDPISLKLTTFGRFSRGKSWELDVHHDGNAQLRIETHPPTIHEFTVSTEQFNELRETLIREHFFKLWSNYGQTVVDGSTDTIRITVGSKTKTVHLRFLMNWVRSDPEKLREPARAIRVGMVVRNWFDHPDAVDLRRYDQMILDAVDNAG